MECNKNGRKRSLPATDAGHGLKRKCRSRVEGVMQLAVAAAVPCTSFERPMRVNLVPPCPPDVPVAASNVQPANYPFMNNMDEISYWIYTKRAPCLFNYDNTVKKQVEQAQCSAQKPASVKSKTEEQQPQNKKRKLKLLDEDSVSTEKRQNVFFKTTQIQKAAPSSCKSNALSSKVNFNIKNSPAQQKPKRMKLQRNCQSTLHKKNKLVTSTPKVVNLRRSLRRAQQNNNTHLNSSFNIFNTSVINGKQDISLIEEANQHTTVASNDQTKSKVILPDKAKNYVLNRQFEDLSDVSGFTANYIRSTKIHLSKKPHKLKNRNSRALIKVTKQAPTVHNDEIIMCVNKSVNTGFPGTAVLNCSSDSSQNIVNLVTRKNNNRAVRINKSTSLLKFMDSKLESSITHSKIDKIETKNNVNVSFQSRSSGASRYPKRHKNNIAPVVNNSKVNTSKRNNMRSKLDSNPKENSEEKIVSKTRSGRRIGVKLDLEESSCSVVQLNNSTEQVSSSVAINVASPNKKATKKNNVTARCLRSRTCRDRGGQLCEEFASDMNNKKHLDNTHCALVQSTPKCVRRVKKSTDKVELALSRDSLKDKSGFAACFSDSDSDSEPLRQRKFFC